MLAILSVASTIVVGTNIPGMAETIKETEIEATTTGTRNKQSAFEDLQKKFYDNAEQQEQWARDRPRREALEAARIETGLVGNWITTGNVNGVSTKIYPWIKSTGEISYSTPKEKDHVSLHGTSLRVLRPFDRSSWGWDKNIFIEQSSDGKVTKYSTKWISEDEFILTVLYSNAGHRVGGQRKFVRNHGTYQHPK